MLGFRGSGGLTVVFIDGGGGADAVILFGKTHEDNALSGTFELRDVFERKFDDLGRFGGKKDLVDVLVNG